MTAVVETITFSDLLAFLRGVKGATSKVITLTEDRGFQSYLALWVYRPLKQIIKCYSNPVRDLVHIPRWLFDGDVSSQMDDD